MILKSIHVPFADKSLNGIIRKISSIISVDNIDEEGLIHLSSNSTHPKTRLSNIIGAPITTEYSFWHTYYDEKDRWVQIDFNIFRVEIEGYTLNTGTGDYFPYWEILASVNGSSWTLIHSHNLSSAPTSRMNSYQC